MTDGLSKAPVGEAWQKERKGRSDTVIHVSLTEWKGDVLPGQCDFGYFPAGSCMNRLKQRGEDSVPRHPEPPVQSG
jgi:hypothetical protein